MERATPPSSILPEILEKDNYDRWSILMRQYLKLQNLWVVVQSHKMPQGGNKEEWIKKNDLALYAIRISCGIEAFNRIKKIRSAKAAWDALAVMQKPPVVEEVTPNVLIELYRERLTGDGEILYQHLGHGNISRAKKFLRENQHLISPEMLEVALGIAINYGDNNMARYLYSQIPLDFLQGDRSFFLLEMCINEKMFDIALHLLHYFPDLLFTCPMGSTPIILTLAQTTPPFFKQSELGWLRRLIYNWTRVKAYSIEPRINPAGGVCVAQDQLTKWKCSLIVVALYKFHLLGVLIGLLGLLPALIVNRVGWLVEVSSLLVAILLKLDVAGILIAVPLLALVPIDGLASLGILFGALILFLVLLRCLDRRCGPIGMPLVLLGALIWLLNDGFMPKDISVTLLPQFLLVSLMSMPLLIFVIQIYNLKLTDEYAIKVLRLIRESLSSSDENQFVRSGAVEATFEAIKNGIPEIAIELIAGAKENIPDIENSRNMFACAIAHRQEKVAHFLYEIRASEDMVTTIDEDGNNPLHLAAKLTPQSQLNHISSAALQLQNQLRWFKAVEGIVPWFYNRLKNKDGETPTQLFVREHGNLLKEAEKWMKKVAASCTVVGALVITIMFAAAFTIPGGNNENTGLPTFLNSTVKSSTISFAVPFIVFSISDAISLSAACSSVLIFMGIHTASRYAFQDFHISLPIRLIIGLSSLFISIAAMVVAFCATLFMMLHDKERIVIPITVLSCIPVALFILLQSPLLVEIYTKTFRGDIFYKRTYLKRRLRVCSRLNRTW